MSWEQIYNQVKRELKREPRSDEVQNRMLKEAMNIESIYHPTTKIERAE